RLNGKADTSTLRLAGELRVAIHSEKLEASKLQRRVRVSASWRGIFLEALCEVPAGGDAQARRLDYLSPLHRVNKDAFEKPFSVVLVPPAPGLSMPTQSQSRRTAMEEMHPAGASQRRGEPCLTHAGARRKAPLPVKEEVEVHRLTAKLQTTPSFGFSQVAAIACAQHDPMSPQTPTNHW
ncbi:unnamed protein product, partial [Pleuronectes platessa]